MKTAKQHITKGSLLGGRYEVLESLGQGGMAYVYLALDRESGRHVALKLMRDELSDDPEFIRRFATEARAAASLDHPNIVRVLDYGQDKQTRYIIQEYVEGSTLKDLINENGAMSYQVAVPLMIQISLALEHAHKRGIIHRDMKPQNVLITPNMTAKVTDFGIARATNANTITLTGGVAFGSVHYFSPEQARGGNVTERSDLYSLGIMLYEMLTGQLPFDGESSVAVAIKQLQEMPLRPSSLVEHMPRGLDDIIFKSIQKNPERRYKNSREFVDELDAFLIDPNGIYGVIQQGGSAWSSGTSAIGIQKVDPNFNKVDEIERNINQRRRSRVRDGVLISLVILIAAVGLGYLLKNVISNITINPANQGDEVIEVQQYIGRALSEVQEELEQIYGEGLELIAVKSEKEKGVIFDQIPDVGAKLPRDQARIKIKYSLGRAELRLKDYSGLTEEEAKEMLRAEGFVPLVRYEYSTNTEKGKVLRSEPAANSTVLEGDSVKLIISQGKDRSMVPLLVGLPWYEAQSRADDVKLVLKGKSVSVDESGNPVEIPVENRVILKQLQDENTEVNIGSVLEVEYGTARDYENMQKGIMPGTTTVPDSMIKMPDLLGKGKDIAVREMQSLWPADAPPFYVSSQGTLTGNPLKKIVILRQSIEPDVVFNPYSTTLYLYYGEE